MVERHEIKDEDGRLVAIREVSDDGRRSELFKVDDSLAGITLRDYKGERIEIAEHDVEAGTTRSFWADNSMAGHVLHDGKGNEKRQSSEHLFSRNPEPAYDSSDGDYSFGRMSSDEFAGKVYEVLTDLFEEVRRERQRQIEWERDRPAREARELAARLERERIEKRNAEKKRLESLSLRADFKGYTRDDLRKKIDDMIKSNNPDYANSDESLILDMDTNVREFIKAGESLAKHFLDHEDPKYEVAARKAINIIRATNRQKFLKKIGGLDNKTDEQLYDITIRSDDERIALEAMETMKDKHYVRKVYHDGLSKPVKERAKYRFYEMLREEKRKRGFIGNVLHNLSSVFTLEDRLE